MTGAASISPDRAKAEIVALQLFVGLLLAMRLWFSLTGGLLGDEAYYWMWGQHPGWSYFDHPPLHAWLLSLMSVFGWHPFSVRALTWVSLAIVLSIFWAWARRLCPANPGLFFWRTAALYLATPLFFLLTAGAYNDHLLVALCLAAVHCFVVFAERAEAGQPAAARWLFGAAILLGLAVLTKYNGVFVGLGFALTFLIRPTLRPLLATPAPWLAALLAVAMQAPVLWWNLAEAGASFRYHFEDRWSGTASGLHWAGTLRFLVLSILFWSPLLVWPLIRLIRTPAATPFIAAARTVSMAIFGASSAVLLALAIMLDAYPYWNIVALIGLVPLLVLHANRWLRLAHYIYGFVAAAVLTCNFAVIPVVVLFNMQDFGTALNYNWDTVASHMQAEIAEHPEALVAGTRYSTTSQLGFALGTADVVKLSPEHSQWDYWQEGRDFTGKSALILVDEPDGSPVIAFIEAHFDTVEVADSFTIEQFGRPIYAWRILLGRGWTP